MKICGLIIVDEWGAIVTNEYDNVLLFKDVASAERYLPIGGRMRRVVTAKVARQKKPIKGTS